MIAIRFARFQAVGLLGIVVQLVAVTGWTLAGVPAAAATALAVETAVVHNYLWHRRWTWGDRPSSFWRFQLTNGTVSLAGNVLIVSMLPMLHPTLANVVAIAVCSMVNFLSAEFFVFARSRQSRRAPKSSACPSRSPRFP